MSLKPPIDPTSSVSTIDFDARLDLLESTRVINAVADYGITTANADALQTAINEVSTAGGGIIEIPSRAGENWLLTRTLTLKNGVILARAADHFGQAGAISACVLEAAPGFSGTYVIEGDDTASAGITAAGIHGVSVKGLGAASGTGGIHIPRGYWCSFKGINADNFSERAILQDAGFACVWEDILAGNSLKGANPSSFMGVVEINGTDHYLKKIESTGSLSAITSNNKTAAILIAMANGFCDSIIGEFADVGIYITGADNGFSQPRADNNFGHGFRWATTGGRTQMVAPRSINNGKAAANTYDGFLNDGAQGNKLIGAKDLHTDGNTSRYSFNDAAVIFTASESRTTYDSTCMGTQYGTAEFSFGTSNGSGSEPPPHPVKPADGTTSVDVSHTNLVLLSNYTSAVTITNFTGGRNGQTLRVRGAAAGVLLANNATIKTNTGADKVTKTNQVYQLSNVDGVWYESTTGPVVQVDAYNTAGSPTWTKPSFANSVSVYVIAAGGGGGSGRKGAAGTVRCGGGGGSAGASSLADMAAADLAATVAVAVATGGAGGTAISAADTDGNIGSAGGNSGFGTHVTAFGGFGGAGGTNAAGAGGVSQASGQFASAAGGAASTTGLLGANGNNSSAAGGGGAGGGITAADVASIGGNGGKCNIRTGETAPAGGAVGTIGTAGTIPNNSTTSGGTGGGGGGGSTAATAGTGGAGTTGSGGGGGGAALDAVGNSGAGGKGGDGRVIVISTG